MTGAYAAQRPPSIRPRFLSEADCQDIGQRLARYAGGGGYTGAAIVSQWVGNVRWARNQISTSGEVSDNHIVVARDIRGARNGTVTINDTSDAALVAAARRAERMTSWKEELPGSDLTTHWAEEPYTAPQLFDEATYQLDASDRAAAARQLSQSAVDAGLLSAGYIEMSAHSLAFVTSWGYTRYFRYTWARYSVTVRDPKGVGSGWAGVDWPAWSKIDGLKLSTLAVDKCMKSCNPVAVEPGRYTTILEPQAVCDFVGRMMNEIHFNANGNFGGARSTFNKIPIPQSSNPSFELPGESRLGERVVDERITISTDPMDPELGFPPFTSVGAGSFMNPWANLDQQKMFHPATWIHEGILKNLSYRRNEGVQLFGHNRGLPISGAFRMSVTGVTTSIEEMIATTKRGLLVTRFDQVIHLDDYSALCQGYTRDGFWLIEDGKISKPVKNMLFTESVMFALNNVEQLGKPVRAFNTMSIPLHWAGEQPMPVIVPPMKVKDFSFTALSDAI